MNLAVLCEKGLNISFKNYVDNLIPLLSRLGANVFFFSSKDSAPDSADLLWDPSQSLSKSLLKSSKPLVVTIQGDYEFGIPSWELYGKDFFRSSLAGYLSKRVIRNRWRIFSNRCDAVISISNYSKSVLVKELGLDVRKVFVAYHGVDLKVFHPGDGTPSPQEDYFLHVSHYKYSPNIQRKNLKRILEAYSAFPYKERIRLKLIASEYAGPEIASPGVDLIRRPVPVPELVSSYQRARGFIFPSLHEGFGVPILEAMACGCPVVTSNVTACPEVAGDAAILVNPRSTADITAAMIRLVENPPLASAMRSRGLARVKDFLWQISAERHYEIFSGILGKKKVSADC